MTRAALTNNRELPGPEQQVQGMSNVTPERILRIKVVLQRTGLSRSTLYRKVREGSFPKQVALAPRCAGWHESAVDAWVKNPLAVPVTITSEVSGEERATRSANPRFPR